MRLSKTRRAWAILRHFTTTGPGVSIVQGPGGSCTFETPATTECSAAADYTANDYGFENPADTWLWTIEPPVVGVDLTNATLKTCTVTTPTSAVSLPFNLKVVASNLDPESAEKISTFTQAHTDSNETPVFIGPDVNNVQFTKDQPLTPFDTTILFTGTNLIYDYIGTLPSGLTYLLGILDGIPDTDEVEQIQFRATNSKGSA